MLEISFTVPGQPVAQPRQRHRAVMIGDRPHSLNYTPRNDPVQSFKLAVQVLAKSRYSGRLLGPLEVRITAVFRRPRSRCTWVRGWHTAKPDCDNLAKSVLDALNEILWQDDGQVASLIVTKLFAAHGEGPHTIIEVRQMATFDSVRE